MKAKEKGLGRGFLLGWASFQSGIPLLDSSDLRFPCAVNHIVGTK